MSAESALVKVMTAMSIGKIIVSYWVDIAEMLKAAPHIIMAIYPIQLKTHYTGLRLARLKKYEINYCITRLIKSL